MARRLVAALVVVAALLTGCVALGVGTNAFTDTTPLPATTTVDNVRGQYI